MKNNARCTVLVFSLLLLAGCDLFTSTETRIGRAQAYLAEGNQRGAIIELKNVVEDEPDNSRARALLAEALLQLGDAEAAQAEMRRALDLGAEPSSVAQVNADILLAQRQYKELEQWLSSAQLGLNEEQRALLLARAKLGQGDFEAADRTIRSAMQAAPGSLALQRGLAEVLAARGDREAALDQLQQIIAKDPGNARALLMQASLLMQGGRVDEAEQAYSAALQHGSTSLTLPQKVIATGAQVEIHLARGDVPKAEEAHKNLTTLAPDSVVANLLSARISLSKQDYAAASAELQRIVTQMPNFVAARSLLGSALYAQGSFQQAERHLTEVIRQAPANIEARKLLAQLRLRMNQPAEAMNVLVPALESEDTDAEVNALANSAQLRIGDESTAVALLERSVQQHPNKPELKLQLANAYLRTGDSDKAVALLKQIESTPDNVAKEALLVAALADSKGIAAAQQEVEALLKAHPRNVAILNLASSFFLRRGDFERARSALARASAVDPKNTLTSLNAARLEVSAGKISVADGLYRKVLQSDPDNAAAHLGLAEIAMRQGKNSEAIDWLSELIKRAPKAVEPRLALARLHLQQKNPSAAEEAVAQALEVSIDKAPVQNAAGTMYLQFGRLDAALNAFRAAAAADAGNVTYLINQARAERALGNLEAARATASRALSIQPEYLPAAAMNAFLDVEAKRPEAALSRLESLKKRRPNDPAVLVLEGELLMALQRPADAAVALERAIALRDSALTSVKLYQARLAAGASNALQPLESWVATHPEDVTVRRLLASAYQTSGRNAKALAEYELLVSQAPADAMSLNNLAWLRHQEGDPRAEQAAAAAYQLAAENAAIADTYGWILLEKGEVERALPILSKAAKATDQPDVQYHYAAALAKSGSAPQAQEILSKITNSAQTFESKAEAQTLLRQLSAGG